MFYFYIFLCMEGAKVVTVLILCGQYGELRGMDGMGKEIINMADSSNKSHNYLLDVVPLK